MRSKKAAMELSVGTIVIIVLAMSMLIFGLILIRNIFGAAQSAVRMTDDQLQNELSKLYGEDMRLGVYPSSRVVHIKMGDLGGFGVGIKNMRSGSASNVEFSYKTELITTEQNINERCGVRGEDILDMILEGKEEGGIIIASGETYITRVTFEPEIGDVLCTVRFRVSAEVINAQGGREPYGSPQYMDVRFK